MIKGRDELKRNLRDLADRAHRAGGQHKVRFDDLFPTDFIRRFTDFLTLEEMFAASGFTIESTADFEQIPADVFVRHRNSSIPRGRGPERPPPPRDATK
jgi:hypothetical protein